MQKNHPMGEEAHVLEVGTCIEIARVRDTVRVVDTNACDAAQLRRAVTDEVFFGGFWVDIIGDFVFSSQKRKRDIGTGEEGAGDISQHTVHKRSRPVTASSGASMKIS
jgi:hypothetical protein